MDTLASGLAVGRLLPLDRNPPLESPVPGNGLDMVTAGTVGEIGDLEIGPFPEDMSFVTSPFPGSVPTDTPWASVVWALQLPGPYLPAASSTFRPRPLLTAARKIFLKHRSDPSLSYLTPFH